MISMARTFTYREIRDMQERRPNVEMYVASEPVVLATCCLECQGFGIADSDHSPAASGYYMNCPECGGSGWRVTENGEAIRKLMAIS